MEYWEFVAFTYIQHFDMVFIGQYIYAHFSFLDTLSLWILLSNICVTFSSFPGSIWGF